MSQNPSSNPDITAAFTKWCDIFYAAPRVPETFEARMNFLICTEHEQEDSTVPPDISSTFLFQILSSRAEFIGLKLTPWACVYLTMAASRPGEAVMLVTYLRSRATAMGVEEVADALHGIPTEEGFKHCWDAQKGRVYGIPLCDNILDSVLFDG
jgi:hypothetical protein